MNETELVRNDHKLLKSLVDYDNKLRNIVRTMLGHWYINGIVNDVEFESFIGILKKLNKSGDYKINISEIEDVTEILLMMDNKDYEELLIINDKLDTKNYDKIFSKLKVLEGIINNIRVHDIITIINDINKKELNDGRYEQCRSCIHNKYGAEGNSFSGDCHFRMFIGPYDHCNNWTPEYKDKPDIIKLSKRNIIFNTKAFDGIIDHSGIINKDIN